jgi:DNA sulfur modification protein DndC
MKKMEAKRVRDRLSPNMNLPNSLVYSPIEDWRDDEVWLYLMQWSNPWGYSNKDLFAMYRGASADNECPLVVDTSTPSCGSSRFGCWVCTMVTQDKSLTAMIQNDEEKEWLQPLLDFRIELDVEDSRDRRDFRRRKGNVQLYERNLDGQISVEPIPGPYTKEARDHLLRRLLTVQTEIRRKAPEEMHDITLITCEELSEIRRIWLEERHEFDDSLPRIYEEVTGESFQDIRPGAERKLLGSDEWEVLQEICNDEMHLELMAKLLDTERQFHVKSRRGVYEKLDKCFESSSRSKEDAIQNAHDKRDMKNAVVEEDIDKVKQLSWASMKFPPPKADDANE